MKVRLVFTLFLCLEFVYSMGYIRNIQEQKRIDGYIELGKKEIEIGDYQTARYYFNFILVDYQNTAEPYYWLGEIDRLIGNNMGAIENYTKAVSLKYNTRDLYRSLGEVYKKRGNIHRYLTSIGKAIEIEDRKEDIYERASFYFEDQQYDKALIDLNKIIDQGVGALDWEIDALYKRALIYQKQKKNKMALKSISEVLDKKNLLEAYKVKADLLYELEDYRKSLIYYDQAYVSSKKSEDKDNILYQKILIFEYLKDYESLIKEVDKLLRNTDNKKGKYFLKKAEALYILEKYEDVDKQIRILRHFHPYIETRHLWINTYFALKDYPKVLDGLNWEIRRKPSKKLYEDRLFVHEKMRNDEQAFYDINAIMKYEKNNDLYRKRAWINHRLRRYRQAIKDINKVLLEEPTIENYNIRGHLYLDRGNVVQAKKNFEKILEIDKKAPESYFGFGLIYFIERKYDESLENYRQAIKIDPIKNKFYIARAKVYGALKKWKEAKIDLDRAISINPQDSESYFLLGLIHSYMSQGNEALFYLSKSIKIAEEQIENNHEEKAQTYFRRGLIYFERKKYKKAIGDFEIAKELNMIDTNGLLDYHLGVSYYKEGNKKFAKNIFIEMEKRIGKKNLKKIFEDKNISLNFLL